MALIEASVLEQQEWLRVTLNSIGEAVITTDVHGRVTFINPVAEQVTGWTLADAVGRPLESVFHILNEETQRPAENPVVQVLRAGLVVGPGNHTLLIARDGVRKPIESSAAPIRGADRQIVGVVLTFRDVTERRRGELKLRESEERFRLLIAGVKDYAIFMLDPEGIVTTWNMGAQTIKGYTADEIIGQHFSKFYPREAVDSKFPDTELKAAAETGRFEDEGWRVRKDGTQFWANVVITALRDETGRLRGFVKVTRDLTERRKLERLNIEAEMQRDLNRRKDEFLAMLSHELRNPLAPLLNAVSILRSATPDEEPTRQQAMGIVERQVANLTNLVDDLLDMSRISTGRIRLRPERIDLRGVAERAAQSVRPLMAEREHALTVALPPEPLWVHADATRLEQVTINLLTNAAKYTNPRGRVHLSLVREDDRAALRVTDNGVGIPPDLLPQVFDLFVQGERSLDRAQGGLGIGLTIVKRIVELHGGRVEAKSEGVGRGSTFLVRMPLAAAPGASPPPALPAPVDPGAKTVERKQRILVVDDNRDAADAVAFLLRRAGHEVAIAYDGREALETAAAHPPDAVLLDIGLPEVDGYEVARRMRQDPRLRHARLVAITGYGRETDQHQSQLAGFDAHLTKPVDARKITEVLATLNR